MQRLRELSEEECYLRCYGWVGEEGDVTVLRGGDPELEAEVVGVVTERIVRAFEARLALHEPEAA
jgi:hypothetical protein